MIRRIRLRGSLCRGRVGGIPGVRAGDDVRYEPRWDSLDRRPTPPWFLDAKFGIFIHWGVYSVPAWGAPKSYAEWYWNDMRDQQAGQRLVAVPQEELRRDVRLPGLRPDVQGRAVRPRPLGRRLPPLRREVRGAHLQAPRGLRPLAQRRGQRDLGPALERVDIGPHRDLLGELADAVRKQEGMKMGFYYSLYEWFNPLWLADRKRYVAEHMIPQFKDVVTRYKPVDHLLRRRVGHAQQRLAERRSCWPGCSTNRRARTKW